MTEERQITSSSRAQTANRDLSALIEDLEDDEWLNEINIEDTAKKSMHPTSQLDNSYDDFDKNSGDSWIFPMNYEKRDYQLNISRSCLFQNVLVCLPTGLGKTFIASVVIYNFYRWFPRSKIIFMAPSRPLVNQQIDACYKVVGIHPSETVELTGRCAREKRLEYWNSKRVFFATPQIIQNDICDPLFPVDAIKLVVVDEAHKAKGKFAYCEVIKEIHAKNEKFRVLALSATPGKQEDVIEIIRNLLISKIEVRTENSIDVRQYAFSKVIDVVKIPLGPELKQLRDKYMEIIDPYLRKLVEYKAISSNNFSKGWIIVQQQKFRHQSHPNKSEITKLFSVAVSLLYSLDLLERHGIQIFLKSFNDDENITKMKYFVAQDRDLKEFLRAVNDKYKDTNPLKLNIHALSNIEVPPIADKNLFYGHPKFDVLKSKITEYFNNGGAKAIIFCEFRDTVTLVFTQLLQLRPVVLPRMLIGQGGAVSQKDQLTTMKDFRSNKVNVLVTTSVCEEGIDVGEVDLVICFDINSKNPTRFVQRIGRTGRKRKGKVIILASEGKELQVVAEVVNSKEKLNKSIQKNTEISNNLYKNSHRLVPLSYTPKCVETKFNIKEIEENDVPSRKKKVAVRKSTKATATITKHFKPFHKPEENNNSVNDDPINEIQEVQVITLKDEAFDPSSPIEKKPVEITKQFSEVVGKILNKVTKNKTLSEHLKSRSEKDLKMVETMSILFLNSKKENSRDFNDLEIDLNYAFIPEHTIQKTDDDTGRLVRETVPIAENPNQVVEEKIYKSQEIEFPVLESRYANQFSCGEPFRTPLKCTAFQPLNKILNSTIKSTPPLATSSVKKKASSLKKKTPIKDSPLIRAFQKQRNMSCSTPVAIHQSPFPQTPEPISKSLQTPSTSAKSNKSKSNESIDVFKYFGITSIDDVFADFDSDSDAEDRKKSDSHAVTPVNCENSIAQLLERDNDILLNIEIDDEIVESSLVEEIPPLKRSRKMNGKEPEEKFDFNIDDIFSSSGDSVEHEKNIESIPSDLSQMTQEYNFEEDIEKKADQKSENWNENIESSSSMKENVLVVNSFTVSFHSPTKSPSKRPRPNIAKLMNTLKTSNYLSPLESQCRTSLSPIPDQLESPQKFKTPLPSFVKTPRSTELPTPSGVSPISSRVIRTVLPKKLKRGIDIIVLENEGEKSPFALPIRQRNPRKRQRNPFLDTQAGVDGSDSSDDDEGELQNSFIGDDTGDLSSDEDPEVDIHLKYIESLRSPSARQNGNFKIPTLLPRTNVDIFSQIPEEDDWEMDSFIVDNVEPEEEIEPDELEVAEMILREKRKLKRQRKNGIKRRKIAQVHESSDEEELKELRKHLESNPD